MSSEENWTQSVSWTEVLDVRKLRLLREFAARGTVAAVAEALAYTPSAVSQGLAALEREAGVPLLEKSGRRLRLTEAGSTLVAHADALLARLEEAEADLQRATGEVRGTVRVSAFQTAALALLPEVLRRAGTEHPDLRVEYVEGEAEETLPALALGELDLVIAEEYEHALRPRHPDVVHEHLLDDAILVALPPGHRLAGRRAVPLEALAGERWAAAHPDSMFAAMFIHACRSVGGFEPDVRHRSNDLRILRALVDGGDAVALVPQLGSPRDAAVHEIAERPLRRTVFAAYRRAAAERPAVVGLLGVLRDVAGQSARDVRSL